MARNDTTKSGGGRSSAMIGVIVVIVAIAVIALFLFLSGEETRTGAEPIRDDPEVAAPAGAGTNPDGVADELVEGMNNQTSTDDFIDQSEATDNVPDLLEPGEGPDPQTDATGLEPAVNGDNGVEGIPATQPDDETN